MTSGNPGNLNAEDPLSDATHGQDPETLPTMASGQRDGDTVAMGEITPISSTGLGTPQIPGYEIVRMLGEGGMGVVYEAQQIAIHRTVALKVLKPAVAREPEFRERFLRESAAAGRVNHPNVVQIFDAGEANGHLYMTFQLINGTDLGNLIRHKGALSEFKSLQVIKSCLAGLQAIHGAGLVHRDIKPGNIFMEDDRRPVIGDLGLARQSSGDDRMTMTGAAMGTPAYMSPEHIQGVADIDIRTDIYALGSMLYKMLTGEEPFQGETIYAITHSIIAKPIPDPRELNGSLSNPIVAIIRKAMAKDRDQRYQNPEQFLQDVDAALGGHQLLHAQGLGTINGLENKGQTQTASPEPAPAPKRPSAHFGPMARSSSFLRTWGKPLAFVIVAAWLILLFDMLRIDTSRFKPDWASEYGRDQYGRFIVLQIGSQQQVLRYIRGGEKKGHVILGAKKSEAHYRNNEAMHAVNIAHDYWIADSEITQALWNELMPENPSTFTNAYYPVHDISFQDTQAFIEKLNAHFDTKQYSAAFHARLPTEDEWEHACRAGVELKPYGDQDMHQGIGYCAGDILSEIWENVWQDQSLSTLEQESAIWEHLDNSGDDIGPTVVKSLQPNRWGLYDFIGNVAEFCSDSWDLQSPHASHRSGDWRIIRGGSWFHHPARSRSGCRSGLLPDEHTPFAGMRLLIEVPGQGTD